jgi:ABC-type multidrug transport system permease subunit
MSGLAKDGRTVIVVTHSVANLDICDRLLVLVPGGKVAYFGPPQDGLKHFGKPGWAEVFQSFDAEPQRDWAGEYRRSAWYQQYVLSAVDGRGPSAAPRQIPPAPSSKNRLAQFSTLCRRYLAVIASDRVYLGLLAGAPVVLGLVIFAIPAPHGLGPAPPPSHSQHQGASPSAKPQPSGSHTKSHPSPQAVASQQVGQASAAPQASPSASAPASTQGSASASAAPASAPASGNASAPAPAPASAQGSAKASARGSAKGSPQPSARPTAAAQAPRGGVNQEASSLLLILVICACFAGAFNAVRELVKERAIYSRERAAGLSTASYLGSKLAVLGFISGVQAAIMVLIGLATRTLPPSGSFLHGFPLAELIIALALLAVVSMALGLFISASVNTSEKTMPILMVVVVVEVVLTGGVFAIAGKVGLEQIAWLSPSRWGYALTASTSNLNKIFPPSGTVDHLWDHTGHQWLVNMASLAVLGLVFAFLAWWQLLRQGPARRG